MKKIKIEGGHKLTGSIQISGAKNSAVALVPASLLSDEIVTKGDHYWLNLKFDTAKCKTKHLEITFSQAEIIR